MTKFFLGFVILLGIFTVFLKFNFIGDSDSSLGSVTSGKNTNLILTGDIMLGRTVMTTSLDKKDPLYPFRKVGEVLRKADLVSANLESPIIDGCPRKTEGLVFCADPKMDEGLIDAGIDVVNLANNHSKNYGEMGLDKTEKELDAKGIKWTGVGNLAVLTRNNIKFGFLGFDKSQQAYPTLTKQEEDLIKNSDTKVDVLVVNMHWGIEYQEHPTSGQKELARQIVRLGADVVQGHHPHWVQDDELVDKKPVYYSLGNFVFDQMWSERTRQGLVVKLVFDSKGSFLRDEKLPIYIQQLGQPIFDN